MPTLLSRYATPLTTGLFVISLVSGVALFFHYGTAAFHGMHEWLSMVLILPFVLHIWKNWRAFITYFKRPPMAIALGLSLAAGIAFAWPSMTGAATTTTNPQIAMMKAVAGGTTAQIAPLYGLSEDTLVAALKEKGFTAAEAGKPLAAIATESGKEDRDIVFLLPSLGK